jgi:hypothetical protein
MSNVYSKDGEVVAHIHDDDEAATWAERVNRVHDQHQHLIEALVSLEAAMATRPDDARGREQRMCLARSHLRSALGLQGETGTATVGQVGVRG